MSKLIRAEWLKLRKSLGFWVLIVISFVVTMLVFVLFSTISNDEEDFREMLNGITGFSQGIGQTQLVIIYISVLSAVFICGEFSNRTFGLSLFSGFHRRKLLASKLTMLFIGVIIVSSVMPFVMLVSFTLKGGFGGTVSDVLPMLRDYGLFLLGCITYAAFSAFLAFAIRNIGGTIGAGIGIGIMLNVVSSIPFEKLQNILKYTFIAQLSFVSTAEKNIGFYLAVMIVTLIVALTCTTIVFEKSDLK